MKVYVYLTGNKYERKRRIMGKEVYMYAKVRMDESIHKEDILSIDFGGYEFLINDIPVQFDFEGHESCVVENDNEQYIKMTTDTNYLFSVTDIDDIYNEHYDELGISPNDITAPFLASATKIMEFYFLVCKRDECKSGEVECSGGSLIELYFQDEKGVVYSVDEKVIGAAVL